MALESPLSLEDIKFLYRDRYDARGWDGQPNSKSYPARHREWFERVREATSRFREASDAEFRSPDMQRMLWTAEGVAGVGQGNAINTDALYHDTDVVERLYGLRASARVRATLLRDIDRVAGDMQREFDELRDLVSGKLGKPRPLAKLFRLFLLLFPEHMEHVIPWRRHVPLCQTVLGTAARGQVADAVLVRGRMRVALGPEADLDEHIRRSIFCWWLQEQHDSLEALLTRDEYGAGNLYLAKVLPDARLPTEDQETGGSLSIWSVSRQRQSLPRVRGQLDSVRALLMSCQSGATHNDIMEALHSDHDVTRGLSKGRRSALYRIALYLGLIENRDGLVHLSSDGEAALEEDPPEVFIERALERVFGLAQALRLLGQSGPMGRAELLARFSSEYIASARAERVLGSTVYWLAALYLIEPWYADDASADEDDARARQRGWALTELGRSWYERLPEKLPSWPVSTDAGSLDTDRDSDPEESRGDFTPPAFATFQDALHEQLTRQFLVFPDDQIRLLHLAWHAPPENGHTQPRKRFAILSGLSGTGKTAFLRVYASTYCQMLGCDPGRHVKIVPVSPDWRDPSGLLGYVNALAQIPSFEAGPALRLLLDAVEHPGWPYFLILDEMNLAQVERYFSPFLSAMETGDRLSLHTGDDEISDVPADIPWPRNLFIGGTVNMDETTFPFSDKVLDRAFTLEFWDVDMDLYFGARRARDAERIQENTLDAVYAFLHALNRGLAEVRRHVGYRAMGEVLDLLGTAMGAGMIADELALWSHLDQLVFAKVLPRLRGHDSQDLRRALASAREHCDKRGLERCTRKLDAMLARLEEQGVTRFFA